MQWFDVLMAVRRTSHDGGRDFTAFDLAVESLFDRYPDRRKAIASAWLGKFARWGYVVRVGSVRGEKRWARKYKITGYGLKRPKPGPPPKWKKTAGQR